MFDKIHLRLTLLCSGITILVLTVTASLFLLISEHDLRENQFSSFQRNMDSLLSGLGSRTVITTELLSELEENGRYLVSLQDNGVEFLWGLHRTDPAAQQIIEKGRAWFDGHFAEASDAPLSSRHVEIRFPSSSGLSDYYGSSAAFRNGRGTFSVLVLESIAPMNARIRRQRLFTLLLVLLASAVLVLFAWYFTGRLLAPIERNRQSQIRFVAAASHELRTPLSVMLSAATACRQALEREPEACDHFLTIISEEGNGMSRLIDDLLTLAGADSHSLPLAKTHCEADTLLLNVYEAFEPLAKERGYRLSIRLPEQKTAPVECDIGRIRQVLSICIHNAFCYTPKGSRITLSLAEKPDRLCLSVADDGPGIPDSQKQKVLERFYRAETSRGQNGHFGLGLSIADEIMRAHKGLLTVSDTPGGGATFTLTLPLVSER